MFSCLQILEAFLWFVLITLLNVTLIILTLSVSRLLNLLLRLVAFLRSEERRVGKECCYLLEGFPFIQEPPSGDLQERVLIRHHDYDQCFQSFQLLQWNSQVKFNVTVYRNLPTTRDFFFQAEDGIRCRSRHSC